MMFSATRLFNQNFAQNWPKSSPKSLQLLKFQILDEIVAQVFTMILLTLILGILGTYNEQNTVSLVEIPKTC